jgi:Ca2+-binding RTX toxin-like protein
MDSFGAADTLDGGPGSDHLSAGGGADRVIGGEGNDLLYGDPLPESDEEGDFAARNHESGPPGDDTLEGGAGNDRLYGGGGADSFSGGAGIDTATLEGGGADKLTADIEILEGSEGNDELTGGPGPDELLGRGGNDRIAGLDGDDGLDGDEGNDVIDGGAGADALDGGPGDDTILARDGVADRITCGDGIDRVTADVADQVESTCEYVDKPGSVTGPGLPPAGAPPAGVLTIKGKSKKSGRKQTLTVSGKLTGTTLCQGVVQVTVKNLRPAGGSATVKPDCTFSVKLVGTAKRKKKMLVSATLGTLAAKPVSVKPR